MKRKLKTDAVGPFVKDTLGKIADAIEVPVEVLTSDPAPATPKPDPPGLEVLKQALTWPEKARAVTITDADGYVKAAELLKGIKALQKEADATFDPIIADAHRAHATACSQKRKVNDPLAQAERIIKNAMVAYDEEQKRKQREEQRRRDEEAKRQADDEALARAAALWQEGKEYGDTGLVAEAEQIVEEQIQNRTPPPTPLVPRETPKVAGIARKTIWSGVCTDLLALVKHVATHPADLNLLQVNQSALNTRAKSMQHGLASIPGCRAVETPDIAAGSR